MTSKVVVPNLAFPTIANETHGQDYFYNRQADCCRVNKK